MQRTSSAKPKRERGNLGFFMLLLMCTTSMTALVRAQQCTSYDPTIAAGTPAQLCALYRLPSSLYENQALNLTQASSAALSSQQLQLAPVLPYECTRVFMPWVCATAYPLCSVEPSLVDPGLLLPVALPTCYETCAEAENACRVYWEELGVGELFPPCNATNPLTGLPIWPQNQSIFPIPPPLGPVPVQCSVPLSTPEEFVFPCPEDLEFNPDDDDQSTCDIPCIPSYVNLDSRYAVYLSVTISSWLSFAFLVVGILIFFLIPAYREWPRRMFFYLAFSILILNSASMMMVFRSYKTLNCHSDFYCGLQTFLTTSFGVISSWWWALTLVITFVTVVWNTSQMNLQQDSRSKVILEVISHIVGWGSGLIPLIFYLAMDAYHVENRSVAAATLVLCPSGAPPLWFTWIAVYLWIMIPLVIVIILAPVIVVYMSHVSSKSLRNTSLRLIVYSGYYVVAIVLTIVNQGIVTSNVDRYQDEVAAWYECSLRGEPECPDVQLLSPVALQCVALILTNCAGMVFVILIALTPRNFRTLRAMFGNLRNDRPVYDGVGTRRTTLGGRTTSRHTLETPETASSTALSGSSD